MISQKKTGIANLGAYKRYREFGGKEQREEPRVREFREFGTVSLRGITVLTLNFILKIHSVWNLSRLLKTFQF